MADSRPLVEVTRDTPIPLTPYGDRPRVSLQNAARDNREDIVRQWLTRLPKYNKTRVLDQRDAKGYTAMHYAAKFNRFKIMTLLVTSGASTELETEDDARLTPLHFSARYIPRYYDEDTQQQENTTQEGEVEVTALSTSKQAMKFFVTFCRVNVNVQGQYGISPLHLACQRGNVGAVEILLGNENIDVTITDDNKDTPLHEAALNGFTEIVELILKKMKEGAITLQLVNDELHTPLHLACREGHEDVVKLILQYGFEQRRELVSAQDNELNTPLHLACESGKDQIVRVLLLNSADLLSPKAENVYPIHIAARYGYVTVVKTMLDSGEDIINVGDIYQRTPLHYAAQFNQKEMINFLIDKGADISAVDTSSHSSLMTAALSGQVVALKTLRERGAAIDVLDDNGKSCVFLAAEANHITVLRAVMRDKIGAKLALTPDSSYNTPLHIAAAKGHLASLRVLLESSENVSKLDSINELGKSPLHLAASAGHPHVVREIITKRPETVLDEDEDGNTALHLACINGYPNVAKALIGAKADIEARNATLWTPLDCAAYHGHAQLVSLLINAGSDVDPTDKQKVTPLQLAAQEGHLNVVNILLDHKANVGLTDLNGYNALDHAIQNGHEQVALAIVKSSQWKQALRNTTESLLGGTTTPLRKLIRKMPEVAEEVFNRCTTTNATKDGRIRPDSEEYFVNFNYEFLEDFQLPESRASRFTRALRKTLRYTEPSDGSDSQSDAPDVAMVKGQTLDPQALEETFYKTRRGFTTTWGPVGFKKSKHPLSIMVSSARTDLLTHPLVTSLLNYKWRRYGIGVYFLQLITYAFFLFFLTCFALLVPNPQTEHCKTCDNSTTNLGFRTITFESLPVPMTRESNPSLFWFIFFSGIITIVLAFYHLLIELYQFLQLRHRYITLYNIVDVTLFISALILAFTIVREPQCYCPHRVQYQFGAVAIFLAWINLILYLKKLDFLGIYVIMFENILITFGKTLMLTLLLVFAFGLSFFMTFYSPEPQFIAASFSTPLRALWKTATMSTGEFEFDNVFRQTPGGLTEGDGAPTPLEFEALARVLWLIFLVFMPIILINLLVGLAVDDIKGIQEAAALKRLELQVELVLNLEQKIPPLRRWFTVGEDITYPNRTNFFTKYWKTESASEKFNNALSPQLSPIEEVQSKTRTLVRDMDKMKETVNDLAERNMVLEKIIIQIAKKHGINTQDLEEIEDDQEEEPSISQI